MNRELIFSIFLPMIVLCIACEPTVTKPSFDNTNSSGDTETLESGDSLHGDTGTSQADTESISVSGNDTDSTDDFSCKYDCVPHCVSYGGIVMDGICEDSLRCCDGLTISDTANTP